MLMCSSNGWQKIETAPRDGTWFIALRAVTIIGGGKPSRIAPEINVVRRYRRHPSQPESGGYWQNTWFNSIADDYLRNALWAPLDALPFRQMWEAIEADRLRQGGEPQPLPMPLPRPPESTP